MSIRQTCTLLHHLCVVVERWLSEWQHVQGFVIVIQACLTTGSTDTQRNCLPSSVQQVHHTNGK
jgi:hypothetical protein